MAYGKFLSGTINTLRKRAGERCSLCNITTSKPNYEVDEWTNLGEAAHIKGRREGLHLRYDSRMSDEERAHIKNGIWMCKICHKKIDSDSKTYTVEFIGKIKNKHEKNVAESKYNKNYSTYEREKEIEHDVKIFEKLDKTFSEEILENYLSHIDTWGWIDLNEKENIQLEKQRHIYKLASNKYINNEIDRNYQKFEFEVIFLHLYMIDSQDKAQVYFPPKLFTAARAVFGLEEVLSKSGNYGITRYEYKWFYEKYKKEIKIKTKETRKAFANYRESVKRNIYI